MDSWSMLQGTHAGQTSPEPRVGGVTGVSVSAVPTLGVCLLFTLGSSSLPHRIPFGFMSLSSCPEEEILKTLVFIA